MADRLTAARRRGAPSTTPTPHPRSRELAERAARRPARRQHPLRAAHRAVRVPRRRRRRRRPPRRRRPRLRRPARRLLGRAARPARRRRRRDPRRPRPWLVLRGDERAGDGVRRGGRRPLPVDRAGPVHQLRHRGQRDGADDGPPRHRPRPGRRVRRTATTAARCTSATAARRCGSRSTTPCCRTTTSPRPRPSSPATAPTSPACSSSRCSGSGGCIPGDPAFLAALRRLTADAGAVLIFDEVMTSRLAVGGAQELLGITPDMTTLGKYLAGGLSFGAFGGRARPDGARSTRPRGGLTHGGTFNNNAFTMAVGAAVGRRRSSTPRRSPRSTSAATASAPGSTPASPRRRSPSAPPAGARSSTSTPSPVPCARRPTSPSADPRWRELFFHDLLDAGFYLAPRGYLALTMDVTDDDTGRVPRRRRASSASADADLA